ncbi:MAG TPA: DUF5916 domain-containing protein [Vicinamibacteria bacterium]|nr:DUF5916 domain-containing protein [Vicinamibacteria bacterium]
MAFLPVAGAPAAQEAFAPPRQPLRIEARRATGPISLDGRLDEPDWDAAPVVRGFRQIEPRQGESATFDTEVAVLYDEEHLYVGARCWDDQGPAAVRVRNLRRDFDFSTDDVFGVSFDTFRDGHNAMVFETNPWGVRRDQEVLDSDVQDLQWDAAWRVRTERGPEGWTVEMAIPWHTLRYPRRGGKWSVNFVRVIRRLNETTGWSPWPRAYNPYRMSYAGLLVGIEPPPPSTNLRLQPYAVASDRRGAGDDGGGVEVGGDLKWAINPGTVLDVTVNTDFAQADADRQVVNLTRFSVLFPEQRPFFLESASLFSAGLERSVRPFFSRRIGLDEDGTPIAIQGGARLTHRNGRRSAGALLVRQAGNDAFASTTFGVGRFVQNVGREGRVGALVTTRFDEPAAGGRSATNTVATLDAFLRPGAHLFVKAMLSGSTTSGEGGDGMAASLDFTHLGNRVTGGWLGEYVGPDYLPAAGFLLRPDLIRNNPGVTFDLRPRWKPPFVRRFVFHSSANVFHRASDGQFEEAQWFVPLLGAYFSDSGWFLSYVVPNWQRLDLPFSPLPGLRVEPGRYQFNRFLVSTSSDTSRRLVVRGDFETGAFYDGRSQVLTLAAVATPSPRASLALSYTLNALQDIGVERADSTTHLLAPTLRLAFDPNLQLTLFYQRNTAARLSTWNARVSWEFRPLSYVYLVYNDHAPLATPSGLFMATPVMPANRQLILKVTFNKQL